MNPENANPPAHEPKSFSGLKRPEFWVGLLAFLIRLRFLDIFSGSLFFEPAPGGDQALYDTLAQNISQGQILPTGVFEYMPLYPWILGLIYALTGFAHGLIFAGFLGALLDSLTAAGIVFLSRRLGAAVWMAALAGGLYALYPTAIIYSVVTMPNSINAFMLLCFTAWAIFIQARTPLWNWGLLGLLGGIIALSFAGMILIFLTCLLCWAGKFLGKPGSKPFLIFNFIFLILGFSLPILPVTLHNYNSEKRFVPITAHGGFNFWMGNHAEATGYPVLPEGFRSDAGGLLAGARREAEAKAGHLLTSAEVSDYWSLKAKQFIFSHPFTELKLIGLKYLKFWNQQEYDDLRLEPIVRLTGLGFTSPLWPRFFYFSVLGFLGLAFAQNGGFLKAITGTGMVSLISFFITTRYRLTLVPLLCILGGMGLTRWVDGVLGSRSILRLRALGILVLSLVLALFPIHQTDFRALDRYNTAAQLLGRGMQHPEASREMALQALEQARKGLEIEKNSPDLYFIMGNAYWMLDRLGEAAEAYQRAILLNPTHASAHYNLGRVRLSMNDPMAAQREAELALKYDPQHPHARELLKEAGERERAGPTPDTRRNF